MKTYDYIGYSDNTFEINVNGDQYLFKSPLELDDLFKDKEFNIHFFAKKNVRENEIFQVYDKKLDSRIGWIIPIYSLESNSHDFFENKHFLRYAYVGIIEAIKSINENIFLKNSIPHDNSILLSNIFHEDTVVLIISKETLGDPPEFEIDRATSSLIRYGYVKLSNRNPNDIIYSADSPQSGKIYIQQTSEHISSYKLISKLLIDLFSYEKNPLFQFFFLYQVFELLIDEIYKVEQEQLVSNIVKSSGDSGKTKNEIDKLGEFLSEKNRLAKLINTYSQVSDAELDSLKIYCNEFLEEIDRESGQSFHKYYYQIRNFLFHQYRDYDETLEEKLKNIVKETIEVLPTILYQFKIPDE